MSLIDDVRRTMTNAASGALEKGQQAAELVRLQAQLKKLQLDRARRMHELGARTFDWHRSGNMVVSGPVPSDVVSICRTLEDLQTELDTTQRELDEAKVQTMSAVSFAPGDAAHAPADAVAPAPQGTPVLPPPAVSVNPPTSGPSDP